MLKDCLVSILKQIEQANGNDFIIVIENDQSSSCQDMLVALGQEFSKIPIHYILEPNLGIPIARQTGVDFALSKGAGWMAFIDDDEELEANWLSAMRRAIDEFDCEALTGPVRYLYSDKIPDWFNDLSKKKRRPSKKKRGLSMKTAATNNTLLRADWYANHKDKLQFDPRFRFTGGSDTDFFYALTDIGGRIIWVDDAVVSEVVPEARLTTDWQLQRARRTAANSAMIACKRKGLIYALGRYGLKSLGRALRGLMTLAMSKFIVSRKTELAFKGKKALVSSLGTWSGLLNRPPQPYLETTGS